MIQRMLKMMGKVKKNEKGFTLVELMVVVVIIGILTAIAVPVYNSVTAKAERGAIEANLRTIDGAIMMAVSTEDFSYDVNVASHADGLKDKIKKEYLNDWPEKPGDYSIIVTTAVDTDPKFRAQVEIKTDKEFGNLDKGNYTLDKLQ